MVELIGYIDGITAIAIVFFSIILGLFNSLKSKAKLQKITGLVIILIGLTMLGSVADFFAVLIDETNLMEASLYVILGYIWIAPILILGVYVGAEAIFPEKKKLIILICAILGLVFEILLIFISFNEVSNTFVANAMENLGDELIRLRIDITLIPWGSLLSVMMALCLIILFIINGIGFIQKSGESSGVVKSKFLSIALGWIIFTVFEFIDKLIIDLGIFIFISRIGIILSVVLLYSGTRPS